MCYHPSGHTSSSPHGRHSDLIVSVGARVGLEVDCLLIHTLDDLLNLSGHTYLNVMAIDSEHT